MIERKPRSVAFSAIFAIFLVFGFLTVTTSFGAAADVVVSDQNSIKPIERQSCPECGLKLESPHDHHHHHQDEEVASDANDLHPSHLHAHSHEHLSLTEEKLVHSHEHIHQHEQGQASHHHHQHGHGHVCPVCGGNHDESYHQKELDRTQYETLDVKLKLMKQRTLVLLLVSMALILFAYFRKKRQG